MKGLRLVTHEGKTYGVFNRWAQEGDLIELTELTPALRTAGYEIGEIVKATYVEDGYVMTETFDIVPVDCYLTLVPTDQTSGKLTERPFEDKVIDIIANLTERVFLLEQTVVALGHTVNALDEADEDLAHDIASLNDRLTDIELGGSEIAQIIAMKEGDEL